MTYKTLELSSFETYLADEIASPEGRANEVREREERLQRFPYSVVVKIAFPELDNAERWCWQRFGPMDGECMQRGSEYRVCRDDTEHLHSGVWTSYWYGKIDYNFGYCEFHFTEALDRDMFVAILPELDWGENYPIKYEVKE
jgi:hypothetical protein